MKFDAKRLVFFRSFETVVVISCLLGVKIENELGSVGRERIGEQKAWFRLKLNKIPELRFDEHRLVFNKIIFTRI